jgi:hypothetical protein
MVEFLLFSQFSSTFFHSFSHCFLPLAFLPWNTAMLCLCIALFKSEDHQTNIPIGGLSTHFSFDKQLAIAVLYLHDERYKDGPNNDL